MSDIVSSCFFSFFFFLSQRKVVLIYLFRMHWVFVAACGLSLVAASREDSSLRHEGFPLWWLLLLQSMGSRHMVFSSCGTWAQ